VGRTSAAAWAVGVLAAVALAVDAGRHENPHRPGAQCGTCHTTGTPGGTDLAPDLEARCATCHDEGPSHRTGMPPVRPEPPQLPLSPDGRITCGTCHFLHGEPAPGEAFCRVDNRKGALCLSCHQLAELQ